MEGETLKTSRSTRHFWLLLGLVFALSRLLFLIFRPHISGDLELYYETYQTLSKNGGFSRLFSAGDFPYPPLSTLVLFVPGVAISFFTSVTHSLYYASYRAWMMVFDFGIAVLIVRTMYLMGHTISPRSILRRTVLYVALPAIISALAYERMELVVAFFIALNLWTTAKDRIYIGALCLGIAIALKCIPVLLIPPMLVYVWSQNPKNAWRRATFYSMSVVAGIAIGTIPFVAIFGTQALSFLKYQTVRGIQIESILSSVALVLHLFGFSSHTVSEARATSIRFPAWRLILQFWTGVGILGMLYLTCSCLRQAWKNRIIHMQEVVMWMVLLLVAGITASKVFSPQYLILVFPLLPLFPSRQKVLAHACGIFIPITLLTIYLYSVSYGSLLDLRPIPILLLALRNIAFITLGVYVLIKLKQSSDLFPHQNPLKTMST